ncbi:hypothetical protein HZC09_06850 [Candidatus Micrarchaeota archaeon]|nr:hypothetical protein [Candidatus Micrarchaeota archaeon]
MSLEETISELEKELTAKEKRQDEVLQKSREVIRSCAKAIRHIHTEDYAEAEKLAEELDSEVKKLAKVAGEDFHHIAQNA